MTWVVSFVLVALSCLISARPSLALTQTAGGQDAHAYQTSRFERSFSSQLLPASAQATEPRRIEKRTQTQTPLASTGTWTPPETPASRARAQHPSSLASTPHRVHNARGPPA